jgi:hypothetical protein
MCSAAADIVLPATILHREALTKAEELKNTDRQLLITHAWSWFLSSVSWRGVASARE